MTRRPARPKVAAAAAPTRAPANGGVREPVARVTPVGPAVPEAAPLEGAEKVETPCAVETARAVETPQSATVAEPGTAALAAAVAGLGLAREQLGEIVAMLEEGSGCQDVVARLTVVSRAVDRAGFAVISTGLRECILHPGQGTTDTAAMEKLFLSLA